MKSIRPNVATQVVLAWIAFGGPFACAPPPFPTPTPKAGVAIPRVQRRESALDAPVARSAPECRVSGDGRGRWDFSDLTIFSAADPKVPILHVRGTSGVTATWSGLAASDQELATIEIGGQGMVRAHGLAEKPNRLFYRRDTSFLDPFVTAMQGYRAGTLLREEGTELVIRQESGVDVPRFFEARVPCDALSWGEIDRIDFPSGEFTLYRHRGILTFLDQPAGKPVLELRVQTGGSLAVLEESDDFVFGITQGISLRFQGWVDKKQLHSPKSHKPWRPRLSPLRPDPPEVETVATVLRDSPLLLGDSAPALQVGIVERGAVVRPAAGGASAPGFAEFTFHNGFIFPPEKKRFFIATSALGETRRGVFPPPPLPNIHVTGP